jgi:hypothetical protein
MHPVDSERFADVVGARLRQLPMPAAPRTLLPRVMAAAQEWARRPWYARGWFTWPLAWKAASIVMLCASGAGAVMLLPSVDSAAARMAAAYTAGMGGGPIGIPEHLQFTLNATVVIWRAIVRPVAPYAFAFAALMYLACAVFGAALNHVVSGRTAQP